MFTQHLIALAIPLVIYFAGMLPAKMREVKQVEVKQKVISLEVKKWKYAKSVITYLRLRNNISVQDVETKTKVKITLTINKENPQALEVIQEKPFQIVPVNKDKPVEEKLAVVNQPAIQLVNYTNPAQIGFNRCLNYWDAVNCRDFVTLIHNESGWNINSVNQTSGACGLGQALPCSKLGLARGNVEGEIEWIIGYIKNRYQTPSRALAFWYSQYPHWY